MHFETFWAVVSKLVFGSAFYVIYRIIIKSCSNPTYDFDELEASKNYMNKYCPVGETAFGKGIFVMTIGWLSMVPSLLYFLIFRKAKSEPKSYGTRAMGLIAVPSAIDMVATALSTYGNPWISLSLAFIFKGGRVVFSAILTVSLLRRKLYMHHWVAVVTCIVGLIVAASSQLLMEPSACWGVVLVLGSELFKALRIVIEERLMKNDSFEPTFLVGIEGVYGSAVFTIALFVAWLGVSGSEGGSFENLPDTFSRIRESSLLIALFCILPPITCIMSITSAVVTRNLSAVHNGLISVVRIGVLWIFELVIYSSFKGSGFGKQIGEPWTQYSWLKLMGLLIVVFSTLLYDEDVKLPCIFKYSKDEEETSKAVKDSLDPNI